MLTVSSRLYVLRLVCCLLVCFYCLLFYAALWNRAGHYIFALWLLSIYLFPRLILAVGDWMSIPYFHTWCGLSANLECRSEMCCTRVAGNTGRKNDAKNRHLAPSHNFVRLYLRN